ncbi:MAG: hypothetical protein H7144_05705 [Burkholderiales bacterium]|nr:hypothetical protein [Phycisphaerae bacterium]
MMCVICLSFVGVGHAQTTKPVRGNLTNHDLLKAVKEYNRRTLVEAYDKVGHHDPKWDPAARKFLEFMVVRLAESGANDVYRSDADVSIETALALCEPLSDSNCDDPLVLYCHSLILKDSGQTDQFKQLLSRALQKLLTSNYPPNRKWWATNRFVTEVLPKDAVPDAEITLALIDQFVETMNVPEESPIDRRVKLRQMSEGFEAMKQADRQTILSKMKAVGKTDPWVMAVLEGRHEIKAAWEARGHGWASTVSPEGWTEFRDRLGKARDLLVLAYNREPSYPEPASNMIPVCMGAGGELSEDIEDWFNRAIIAQVDYQEAWQGYVSALMPRWGGSHRQMYELGCRAMMTGRYDTNVPEFLLESLMWIIRDREGDYSFFTAPGLWDNIDRVFTGYLKRPGSDPIWIKSRRAAYAFRCQKFEEVARIADELKEALRPHTFAYLGLDTEDAVNISRAIAGDATQNMAMGYTSEINGDYLDARNAYRAAKSRLAADSPVRAIIERHDRVCALQQSLLEGHVAQIPLASADDLVAWRPDDVGWSCDKEGLTFALPGMGKAELRHRAGKLGAKKVHVEWYWSSANKVQPPAVAMVVQDIGGDDAITVALYPDQNAVRVRGKKWTVAKGKNVPDNGMSPDVWHSLDVTHEGDVITVEMDGVMVVDHHQNDWLASGNSALGLWAGLQPTGGIVKVRNLTVQKIEKAPK